MEPYLPADLQRPPRAVPAYPGLLRAPVLRRGLVLLSLCSIAQQPHLPGPPWPWPPACLSYPCYQLPEHLSHTCHSLSLKVCSPRLNPGFAQWVTRSWDKDLSASRVADGPWTLNLLSKLSVPYKYHHSVNAGRAKFGKYWLCWQRNPTLICHPLLTWSILNLLSSSLVSW